MVLAAGIGKRMRPLTATVPKPLIEVAGRALIDHAFDRLERADVETAVVNVHYLADLVRAHVSRRKRPEVIISDEGARPLDTGGGVAKALPLLGSEAFYLLNSDSFWIEGARPNLDWLAAGWNDATMDALLLLAPTVKAVGYSGRGDFRLDPSWRAGASARSPRSPMPAPRSSIPASSTAARLGRSRSTGCSTGRSRRSVSTASAWTDSGSMSARPTPSAGRR